MTVSVVDHSVFFIVGLAAAFLGAHLFVRAAVSIATRFEMPPVVIGLTIVAWGTSAPELAVSMDAALRGESGVALGNVVGSNILNLGIILGLAAAVHPLRIQLDLIRFDAPLLLGVTLLFCLLFVSDQLSRFDGAILVLAFLGYSWLTLTLGRREVPAPVAEEYASEQPPPVTRVSVALGGLALGLALLLYGGDVMVDRSVSLARATGISERVIGLTIVAAGTSLPELVTSLVATLHRSADIAVGNVIGSNIFNLTAILGLSSLVAPIDRSGLTGTDLAALVISALVLLPLIRTGFVITRWEGWMLMAGYTAYVLVLFW